MLICTGDRDSIQLVTEDSTVLYPMRGVSDLARLTPAAVEEKYGVPPHRYPELAAIVGETSDNLPGVPGRRPGLRREVDQPVRRPRQRHRPRRRDHRQEGRGAARAPRRRDPQPPAQRAGPRPDPAGAARRTSRRQPWDRTAGLELLDELEFRGELRTRLHRHDRPRSRRRGRGRGGLRARRRAPGRGRGRGVARRARAGRRRASASPCRAAGAPARARSSPSRWRPRDGAGGLARRGRARRPTTTPPLAGVAGRPGAPQGDPRRQGARGSRWPRAAGTLGGLAVDTALAAYLVQPDQRSYDLADLTLRYLKRELRAGRRRRRPAHASTRWTTPTAQRRPRC